MIIFPTLYLSEDVSKALGERYPVYEFKSGGELLHTHPVAHVSRTMDATAALTKAAALGARRLAVQGLKPAHIGGFRPDLHIHFLYGCVAPKDDVRYKNCARVLNGNRTACDHEFVDCDCFDFDYVLLFDRIYYYGPEDVDEFFDNSPRCRLVSAHQVFDEPRGGFYHGEKKMPEFQYQRRVEGTECFVTVNETFGRFNNYQHSAADWLRPGKWSRKPQPGSLIWESLSRIQEREVIEFHRSREDPDLAEQTATGWLNNTYYGTLDFGKPALRPLGQLLPTYTDAYSVGRHVIVHGHKDVVVLKDLVSSLSTWAQGRDFEEEDFIASMYNQCRNEMKAFQLPQEEVADMVGPAVHLALKHAMHQGVYTSKYVQELDEEACKLQEGYRGRWYHCLPKPLDTYAKKVAYILRQVYRKTAVERKAVIGFVVPIVKFLFGKGLTSKAATLLGLYGILKGVGLATFCGLNSNDFKVLWLLTKAVTEEAFDQIKLRVKSARKSTLDNIKAIWAWLRSWFPQSDLKSNDNEMEQEVRDAVEKELSKEEPAEFDVPDTDSETDDPVLDRAELARIPKGQFFSYLADGPDRLKREPAIVKECAVPAYDHAGRQVHDLISTLTDNSNRWKAGTVGTAFDSIELLWTTAASEAQYWLNNWPQLSKMNQLCILDMRGRKTTSPRINFLFKILQWLEGFRGCRFIKPDESVIIFGSRYTWAFIGCCHGADYDSAALCGRPFTEPLVRQHASPIVGNSVVRTNILKEYSTSPSGTAVDVTPQLSALFAERARNREPQPNPRNKAYRDLFANNFGHPPVDSIHQEIHPEDPHCAIRSAEQRALIRAAFSGGLTYNSALDAVSEFKGTTLPQQQENLANNRDRRRKRRAARAGGIGAVFQLRPPGYVVGYTYCAGDYYKRDLAKTAKIKLPSVIEAPHVPQPLHNYGITMKGITMSQDMYCIHNERAGLYGRVLAPAIEPCSGWWRNHTQDYLKLFDIGLVRERSFEEWCSRFTPAKRKRYQHGLDNNSVFCKWYSNARASAHVKVETNYQADEFGYGIDHDPRIIQASTAEEASLLGPFIWSASLDQQAHTDGWSPPGRAGKVCRMIGLRAEQMDDNLAWCISNVHTRSGRLVFIMVDGVRHDVHQHKTSHPPYVELQRNRGASPVMVKQLEESMKVHGHTAHGIAYSVDGGQRSGQVTTTDKNTDGHIVVMNASIADHHAWGAVGGDDGLVVCLEQDAPAVMTSLRQTYYRAGFKLEMHATYDLYRLEFFSGRFWPAKNKHGFAFGPKFGKLLPKLFVMRDPRLIGNKYKHIRGVCLGLLASVDHLPIAGAYIRKCLEIAEQHTKAKATGRSAVLIKRMIEHQVARRAAVQQSPLIYEAYQDIYGLTKGDICRIEEQINNITELPAIITHHLFKHCNEVDKLGHAPADNSPVSVRAICGGFFRTLGHNFIRAGAAQAALTAVGSINYLSGKVVGDAITTAVVAPLLEEVARFACDQQFPFFTTNIIAGETFQAVMRGIPLWARLPAIGLHTINALICRIAGWYGLPVAVVLHGLFNVASIWDLFGMRAKIAKDLGLDFPDYGVLGGWKHFRDDIVQQAERITDLFSDRRQLELALSLNIDDKPETSACYYGLSQNISKIENIQPKFVSFKPIVLHTMAPGKTNKPNAGPRSVKQKRNAAAKRRRDQKKSNSPARRGPKPAPRPEFIPKHNLGQRNPYLASLLDPEGHQGVRYPDGFSQMTAMVPAKVRVNIPYWPSTSSKEKPGSFNLVVRPSCVKPVWTFTKSTKGAGANCQGTVDEQASYGLFPANESDSGISQEIGAMILPPGEVNNVKFALRHGAMDELQEPYKDADVNGLTMYGHPLSGFATAAVVNATVEVHASGLNVAAGDTLKATFFDSVGTTPVDTTATCTLNQERIVCGPVDISTLVPASSDAGLGRETGRPGVGVRLTWTKASGGDQSLSIDNIFVRYVGTASAYRASLVPLDLATEDLNVFLTAVDTYRCVSMSSLLSFVGSDLYNGGMIASTTYLGGGHPNDEGFWKYEGIAGSNTHPHAGPLSKGTYCIWKPRDNKDMNMTKVLNPDEWEKPYIAIAGYVGSPDVLNMLTLTWFANFEVCTKARFLDQRFGVGSIRMREEAMAALRTFPLCGENDSHLANIRNVLKKVVDFGRGAVEWVVDNKGWLVPVATGLAALL